MQESLFYDLLAVLMRVVCYPIGWLVLRLLTFGHYPRRGIWLSGSTPEVMTTMLGVVVLLVGVMALAGQFVVG
ncbi:hypothetical protein [Pseudomonas sp. NPDC089406]|uniref:hypothetical protein n=1 Tax=Pseudomonas sp. NPDC089406 TaxID=3364463 RepID=UPI00384A7539